MAYTVLNIVSYNYINNELYQEMTVEEESFQQLSIYVLCLNSVNLPVVPSN